MSRESVRQGSDLLVNVTNDACVITSYSIHYTKLYDLGQESDEIYAFTHKALAALLDDSLDLMANVGLAMETGRINYVTMELLNQAHVEAYGHPVPTKVQLGTKVV